MAYLQLILYSGGALLAASVLGTIGYLSWSLAQVDVGDGEALIKTVAFAMGLVYSVGLVCLYLPSVMVMHYRARRIAAEDSTLGLPSRIKWLDERGLGATISKQVASLVAVLGPTLVGGPALAIAELFKAHQ
jgi:hypothetical protein